MAYSGGNAKIYLPILDEIYKAEAKSAILRANDAEVKAGQNAKDVMLFKMDVKGLGDYSAANGFASGDATGTWETHTLTQDRGRSFSIDSVANADDLNMAVGTLGGEFLRTQVIPEVDAYTFASIGAIATANSNVVSTDISTAANAIAAVDTALGALDDAEVPSVGRILFMREDFYRLFASGLTRTTMNGDGVINSAIKSYEDALIVRVPKARFATAITTNNGSNSAQGGYSLTTSGYRINFLALHPSACKQIVKHVVSRMFTPEQNQQADAYKWDYRLLYDLVGMTEKANGIYMHKKNTAISGE